MNNSRFSPASLALPLNISAYLFWAAATLLFKQLGHLSIWLVFAHRILWSLLFCLLLLGATGGFRALAATAGSLRQWKLLALTSLLIATNWLLVIQAIGARQLLDVSLGYYFAPLISLLIAKYGLREPWRRSDKWLMALSSCGVLLIVLSSGLHAFPWLALVIATTFAAYSALKKPGNIPPLVGLSLETALAAIPAAAYLVYLANTAQPWLPVELPERALLVAIGFVTTVPMLFYVMSVRFLPMTLVSNLQFLNPTLMFLVAGFVLHESLNAWRLAGFAMIWAALFYRFFNDWINPLVSKQDATPGKTF